MSNHISLNGPDWLFKDFHGEDWLWRGSHQPATRDTLGWRRGTVPGSVLHDLWQAGAIADPYCERNSLLAEWVPARTWIYKKTFRVSPEHRGRRIRLRLTGVDYAGRFYLNGELLGEHSGMFTPVCFEVADRLDFSGENLLAVVIEPAPHEEPQVGRTSRVRTHKARMNYWWDFCPRLVHQGIWDEVGLDISGPVRIEDVYVRPRLSPALDRADAIVTTTLSATSARAVEVETRLLLEGEVVAAGRSPHLLTTGRAEVQVTLPVPAPRLWWPNGYGSQPLYQAEVTVWQGPGDQVAAASPAGAGGAAAAGDAIGTFSFPSGEMQAGAGQAEDRGTFSFPAGEEYHRLPRQNAAAVEDCSLMAAAGGPLSGGPDAWTVADDRSVTFGIRQLTLVANDTPDHTALPYTLLVNGRKIYINGWNWTPLDALYGVERPEKLAHLLEMAARGHVNLLRVWGGGLIEKESFYDQCDRRGILIWQEFSLSSSGIDNAPSADPGYVAMLRAEAEQIVPGRRNHPALALWCGGNELQDGPERPLTDEGAPALATLHEVVARIDPDRAWLPTSPTGRCFGNSLENIARDPLGQHDVHGPWEHQGLSRHYELYSRGTSLLHSEFGVEGLTNLRTLERTLSPAARWPVTRANPAYFHSAAWWLREETLHQAFGELPDLATTVRASQFLQHDGLRYAVEADRRRQWRNSGTLPWQLNEPFPNAACTSTVDYFGRAKPAYHAVAAAYAPLSVSARFDRQAWGGETTFAAEAWVAHSGLESLPDTLLTMRIIGAGGSEYGRHFAAVSVPANDAAALAAIRCPLAGIREEIFFLDLALTAAGACLAANRYLFSAGPDLRPLLRSAATTLAMTLNVDDDCWRLALTNSGSHTAIGVWLEDPRPLDAAGRVYFDPNYLHLFPGETRRVTATWRAVAPAERRLAVQGWNTSALLVAAQGPAGGAA